MTDKEATNSSNSYKHTLETRQKISEACKGRIQSYETCQKISKTNKDNYSLERRNKVSEANRLRVISPKTRQKMCISQKARKIRSMTGKHHSIETKQKISKANTGRIPSFETRQKMSKSQKGKSTPIETRLKMSIAQKGQVTSLETRQKISDSMKGKGHPHSIESKAKISEANRRRVFTNEMRKNLSHGMKGKTPWNLGIPHSKKSRKKMSLSQIKQRSINNYKSVYKNTRPELAIKKILFDNDIFFIHQCHVDDIEHQYVADFYLPDHNCVVEADGTYWHNYPIGNEIDHIRTAEMKAKGYNVLRFWDGQIEEQDVLSKIQGLN